MKEIKPGQWIRFACIALLWLLLVVYIVANARRGFVTYFSIVASGIIVFVPLYKKYLKD